MKPKTYQGELHPEIPFDRKCTSCSLSTGLAVGGGGPDDLKDVRLVVISDYPGGNEMQEGYPFVQNDTSPKRYNFGQLKGKYDTPKYPTAGRYLRETLYNKFNLDTWEEVWCTNAIKCTKFDPYSSDKTSRTISNKHRRTCVRSHLLTELSQIDRKRPRCPILIAGQEAFYAINFLDKKLYEQLGSLRKVRRTNHHKLWEHPLVFTYNPATAKEGEFRIESQSGYDLGFSVIKDKSSGFNVNRITRIERLPGPFDYFPGSPRWVFEKDLDFLGPVLSES